MKPDPAAIYPAFRRGVQQLRPRLRKALDTATSPVGSVLRVQGTGRRMALTFDDGPDPDVTARLLAGLEEARVQVTFFMLVSRVRRYPGLAAEVVAAGHEVALHGLDHRRLTDLPVAEAKRSITFAKAELGERLGVDIRWFRPPYGAHGPRIWRHIKDEGMEPVLWGPSLADWKHCEPSERWARAAAEPGDIVLGHDGIAGIRDGANDPEPPPLDRAAWALDVIQSYQARDLTVGTVGALMKVGTPVKGARFTR